MTVINPSSISGITSITMPSGDGNVLTIHTNDGVERFRIDSSGNVKVGSACTISQDGDVFFTGVTTATTYAGSGANLTNLPAANLTGTLPAISGANLTGMASTENVRTGILDVAGISTFRNTMNVGTAVTISESGIEASGIGITVANINGGAVGGRRNLIINGAMLVAQRGTSSTTNGYGSVDRFMCTHEGTDEAVTHAQVDVSSGTTPYSLGFRKAMKLTNGNQTGGVGGADVVGISQAIEAQHIASSGWNYTSATSFVTLSFWVKSSVAQNFYGYLYIQDGTAQLYSFETGSLTADTWTKIIKKVPGNSNITINNDNGFGMQLQLWTFLGTNYTGTTTLNQWANFNSSVRTPNFTSTWYTTNDSTFEMTGVQIEVGPEATSFEHRSFAEELQLCKRYYQQINQESSSTSIITGFGNGTNRLRAVIPLMVETRANPTVALDVSGGNPSFYSYTASPPSYSSLSGVESTKKTITVDIDTSSVTAGAPYDWRGSSAFITISSEL